MRQISRRMEMIHPTIGWRLDDHGTHKHALGSWILSSVVRPQINFVDWTMKYHLG